MTTFRPDDPARPGDPREDAARRRAQQALTVVVASMAGALVIIGVVLALIGAELATPEWWMLAVVGGASVVAWVLAATVKAPQTSAPAVAAQTTTILRVAVLEFPALLGMVLAFLSDPFNLLVYLVPAVFSLVGIWLFARPSVVMDQIDRSAQTR